MKIKGNIQQRGENIFRIRIDLDPKKRQAGPRRPHTETVRGTREDAEQRLTELNLLIMKGQIKEPSKATVSDWLEAWLSNIEMAVEANTFQRYEIICRTHWIRVIGNIRLQSLSAGQIREAEKFFLSEGRANGKGGLSPRTVLHHHRVLHEALDAAVADKMIEANPAASVKPPKQTKKEIEFLDQVGAEKLLAGFEGRSLYPIVLLAVTSGMRRSEILGLHISDINFDEGWLKVTKTLEQTKAYGIRVKQVPKTSSSRRRISLPAVTIRALKAHLTKQQENLLRLGVGKRNDGPVFLTEAGQLRSPNALSRYFDTLVKKIDIKRITFHGLRHTHITHLLMNNSIPFKVVSARAGHA